MRPVHVRNTNSINLNSIQPSPKPTRQVDPSDILKRAFIDWWIRDYPHKRIDTEVLPYLELPAHKFGWIKSTRESLFLSSKTVAKRLSMDHAAYLRLETREQEGRVTLKYLARVAQAMDCELIYAIRPKERVRFSYTTW